MNILITSAGRRGYLIKYFKEVVDGKVYAGNSEKYAPAFRYADEFIITPQIYNENYIPFLLNTCMEKNISVIISLFDIDLLILAENIKLFESNGIKIIVSSADFIKICNDKWLTHNFCVKNQILVPKTYLNVTEATEAVSEGTLTFPLVVKPRWGSGSIAIYEANNINELLVLYNLCKRKIADSYLKFESENDLEHCVIIQEKISGLEYGIDILNDLNGNYRCNVIKRKLGMRAGETDAAIIEDNPILEKFATYLAKRTKHIGNLDVDLFVVDDKIYLLEMNARFGGGYPFSHLAGVNFPKAIINMIRNIELTDELLIKNPNQIVQKDIGFVIY